MSDKIIIKDVEFLISDLETIKLEEMLGETISPGHIMVKSRVNGHPFLILRAGDFIEDEFIKKYSSAGIESFYFFKLIDDLYSEYSSLILDLKNAKDSKEQIICANKIVLEFNLNLKTKSSALNFIKACFDHFSFIPKEKLNYMYKTSTLLYQRAIIASSYAIIHAINEGFYEYNFLKDLYNCTFMMDYGLISDGCDYQILLACEYERKKSGDGLVFLTPFKEVNNKFDLFYHHPIKSFESIKEFENKFTYSEIIEFVKFQHEQKDGNGFPLKKHFTFTSPWELILSTIDKYVPFEEKIFSKTEYDKNVFYQILKNFYSKNGSTDLHYPRNKKFLFDRTKVEDYIATEPKKEAS